MNSHAFTPEEIKSLRYIRDNKGDDYLEIEILEIN